MERTATVAGRIPKHGKTLAAGIDLGATNARLGLVGQDGKVVAAERFPTDSVIGAARVLDRLATRLEALLLGVGATFVDVIGVGIGCPGAVDSRSGVLVNSVNLGWRDVSVRAALEESLGIPTFVQQDAAVAALGERWLGAARGADDIVFLAVGTGIGAGIVIGGQPYLGKHGFAGNVGHIVLREDGPRCSCGKRGCLEALAAGPAIARSARDAVTRGHGGLLVETASRGEEITARTVVEAARAGDPVALAVLEASGRYLGQGLALLASVLDPQVIVVGGGLVEAGGYLLDPARNEFHRTTLDAAQATLVVESHLRDNAGVIGAAWLAWTAGATTLLPRTL